MTRIAILALPIARTRLTMIHALPLAVVLILLPMMAWAHVGHDHGTPFAAGLGHPVGGTDHLLAMVAVGLWAALTGGRAIWALPLAFLAGMVGGGAMGALAIPLPGVEPMILVSIIALGAAVALALRPGLLASVAAVALFGLFHGHAHGAEGPETGLALYAAGFVLATSALHLAGLALGLGLQRLGSALAARTLGAATAGTGLLLALGAGA